MSSYPVRGFYVFCGGNSNLLRIDLLYIKHLWITAFIFGITYPAVVLENKELHSF